MSEKGSSSSRKSLKTLQRVASDEENLVGRPSKALKHQLSQESPVEVEVKRKNLSSKETQTNLYTRISVDDFNVVKAAADTYWKLLVEANDRRRVTRQLLRDAIDEIEELRKVNEDLMKENTQIKQIFEEADSYIQSIKEEMANTNDDTWNGRE